MQHVYLRYTETHRITLKKHTKSELQKSGWQVFLHMHRCVDRKRGGNSFMVITSAHKKKFLLFDYNCLRKDTRYAIHLRKYPFQILGNKKNGQARTNVPLTGLQHVDVCSSTTKCQQIQTRPALVNKHGLLSRINALSNALVHIPSCSLANDNTMV